MPTTPPASAPAPAPATTAPETPRPGRAGHRYDIDLIRLVCSVAVIGLHTGSAFVNAVGRTASEGPGTYWAGLTADSAGRFAVPLFFAIAGWVVLVGAPPKDGARLRRRIVRIVVPLAVWTALYLAWGKLRDTNDDPVRQLALDSAFASVRPAYHLWYLYAYLPVIMVLGLVVLVRAGKRPWGLGAVLLVLAAAPSLLGDLAEATGRELPRFGWAFAPYQLIYAVLGALLLAAPAGAFGRRRWPWLLLAAAGLAGVIAYQHEVHYAIPYAHVLVALFSCGVLVSLHGVRVPERMRPTLAKLSEASFGAYLVHVLVLGVLTDALVGADLGGPAAVALVAGITVATTALSFGAALLWRRVGASKVLG
ncbi:acyltransferase family protein [Streptomyces sp. SID5614]|uniref:acyltransferase n=1 Tax=Streptomyces sp. SID5614 TaxID=2690306 RepID=UPI0013718F29|nr:acyltransferase family protein [Streptomyces sp. SID5614]MZG02779.1 acyltransferase family protein [Streptomyces sp. SID5614]